MQELGIRSGVTDGFSLRDPVAGAEFGAAVERPMYTIVKRSFDIAVALAMLLITAPVWLVVATLVRLTSPGPVIYRQVRVGKDGVPFTIYKFRTMVQGADRQLIEAERRSGELVRYWEAKTNGDARTTAVGRWLRKTSIDELPQLLNVLKGDMSVVGPRPIEFKELNDRIGRYGAKVAPLTLMKPGLTSSWTVSGRSLCTYEERIELELEYVKRAGFAYDLLVLLLTVPAVITGRGAA